MLLVFTCCGLAALQLTKPACIDEVILPEGLLSTRKISEQRIVSEDRLVLERAVNIL